MTGLSGSSDVAEDGRGHDGHNTIRRIAVFCGASSGNNPEYIECAKKMGQEMVKRGIGTAATRGVASCCQPVFALLHVCSMGCSFQMALRHWCTSYEEGLLSPQCTEETVTDNVR